MESQNLSYKSLLNQKGFPSYLWVEFLSALNDNLYKITLTFLLADSAMKGISKDMQSLGISIIGMIFMVPFLIFSGWGGYLADKYPKRLVLIRAKQGEFFAILIVCGALYIKDFGIGIIALFILMIKSAFLTPSKYGIIPEITTPHQLSRANGLVQMSTFVAILIGSLVAGVFSAIWGANTVPMSIVLVILGAFGWWISYYIPHTEPTKTVGRFPLNPWKEIGQGFKRLRKNRLLRISCFGSFWFWMTASLCQTNLLMLGKDFLEVHDFLHIQTIAQTLFNHPIVSVENFYTALLATFLAIGMGYGSGIAGFLSGDKVELGLMPLGALGISIGCIYLSFASSSYYHAVCALLLTGFSCGFFMVPLNSFIQSRASPMERGRLMATQSFFDTSGIITGAGLYFFFIGVLGFEPPRIFLIVGLSTLFVSGYVARLMPIFLIRFLMWLLVHTFYRIRVVGRENVPLNGPALLVANHVSYVDGILISACVSKNIQFLVYGGFFKVKFLNWFFKNLRIIPVRGGKDLTKSLQRARSGLLKSDIIGIFAEGQLTRTGNMLPFKRGFEKIVEDLPNIPIVPIYLDGLWWSIFSFEKGKFFFKIPSFKRLDITICFGEHLPSSTKAWELRQAIAELGSRAVEGRRQNDIPLGMQLIQIARLNWFKDVLGDWGRKSISYGRLVIRSLTLAYYFRKHIKEERVGVYLEDKLQKAIVNIALNFAGKVSVNLDVHEPLSLVKQKLKLASTKTVVTLKSYGGRNFEESLFLETIPKVRSKLKSLLHAGLFLFLPSRLSFRMLCDYNAVASTPVTLVFTETLKPLVFTHSNILAQTQSLDHIFFNEKRDLLLASLPLTTIDGLILGLWLPLFAGLEVVYDQSKHISGQHIQDSQVTFLVSSAHTYRTLLLEAKPFHLASLKYAVVIGSELSLDELKDFESKFGIELLEGHSVPELCGLVSLNHKSYIGKDAQQIASKAGTIGQAIPGASAKILHPETLEVQLPGEKGILFFKSPGRAQGGESWHNTRRLAMMDDAGFIVLEKEDTCA